MSTERKATYIRVSTEGQNTGRQEEIIQGKAYIEKISGRIPFKERKQGSKLLADAKSKVINYIIVEDINRLGRDTFDVLETINTLIKQDCTIEIVRHNLISKTKGKDNFFFTLMTGIMASLAEMDYMSNREAQRQGIAVAKAKGVYQQHAGKGKMSHEKYLEQHSDIIELLNDGKSIRNVSKLVKKSVSTVQRVKKFVELEI
ncbi:recombinase family protein [Labilibaculum sp. K2S]|uniref:recombinase family protein n=1 Tax=Labilibaculum sp. K2S TaxID=3056386 RepID=UPI0025A4A0E1|nr:recombinase family protein [Labilibaculum sp. K2S]MDM8160457.1 recombinase family protein [Labilibaculum sp. K2S]